MYHCYSAMKISKAFSVYHFYHLYHVLLMSTFIAQKYIHGAREQPQHLSALADDWSLITSTHILYYISACNYSPRGDLVSLSDLCRHLHTCVCVRAYTHTHTHKKNQNKSLNTYIHIYAFNPCIYFKMYQNYTYIEDECSQGLTPDMQFPRCLGNWSVLLKEPSNNQHFHMEKSGYFSLTS